MTIIDLAHISAALVLHRGEATVRTLAADALAAYQALDDHDRQAFFRFLLDEMSPDEEVVNRAIDAYRATPGPTTLGELGAAVEPVRQEFLRQLNTGLGATRHIVEMRADLRRFLPSDPELAAVDADFLHLLASWFNRGFLTIRRLDWNTPAMVLEKLIEYEAVHEIRGWSDLQRRLAHDRRLYAYFHPSLPDEPIIFVEVALTDGLAGSIPDLLHQPQPGEEAVASANTAIFYSITNTQPGLRGISFGNFLIKQVTRELGAELPHIRTFSTLSPIPGFTAWLRSATGTDALSWMPSSLADRLPALDAPSWVDFPELVSTLRPALERACAQYLTTTTERRGRPEPLDPVARFHLRNGAQMRRINWMGDPSQKGLRESAGLLVNYVYDVDSLEANVEGYATEGAIDVDPTLTALAAGEDAA